MFDTNAVKNSFGRAAADYDAHAELQRDVRSYLLDLSSQLWPAGARVLDVGCGTGAFFSEAKSFKWNMAGVDVAPGMCEMARMHNKDVTNASAEAMPFADASFDGLFSSLMLQWMNDPARVFSEMARILKPKCQAAISTFAEGTLVELQNAFEKIDDTPHVSPFLPPEQLLKLAKEAGFGLVLARQMRIVEYYPDLIALMRNLQSIGATNRHIGRRKGLMTSRQFAKLEQNYPMEARGLPVTWQALYLVLQKL